MPTPFGHTLAALRSDGFLRSGVVLALGTVLLGGYVSWLFLARVSVYAISERTRLESGEAAHPIESPVRGRVIAVAVRLRDRVSMGDPIVELDASGERLALAQVVSRRATLESELEPLERVIAAEERALAAAVETGRRALKVARAEHEEAMAAAELAKSEARRASSLVGAGHVSAQEREQTESAARQRTSSAEARRLVEARLASEQTIWRTDRQARLEQLRREAERLRGQVHEAKAEAASLEDQIARRTIRAPIDGEVAELAHLRLGTFVDEGERVAAVLPVEDAARTFTAVAEMRPTDALGRIAVGQTAQIRLHGFPWMQYGTVHGEVERVASEVREGLVRVEIRVPGVHPTIPLQHGLPGTAEVEVERVSPWTLLVRAAGKALTGPEEAPAAMPSRGSAGGPGGGSLSPGAGPRPS